MEELIKQLEDMRREIKLLQMQQSTGPHTIKSVSPTANDDSSDGWNILSFWVDTSINAVFICANSSVGAAVWVQL